MPPLEREGLSRGTRKVFFVQRVDCTRQDQGKQHDKSDRDEGGMRDVRVATKMIAATAQRLLRMPSQRASERQARCSRPDLPRTADPGI